MPKPVIPQVLAWAVEGDATVNDGCTRDGRLNQHVDKEDDEKSEVENATKNCTMQ